MCIPVHFAASNADVVHKTQATCTRVASERFDSELFQKAPDLFASYNKNQHKENQDNVLTQRAKLHVG